MFPYFNNVVLIGAFLGMGSGSGAGAKASRASTFCLAGVIHAGRTVGICRTGSGWCI